MAATNEDHRRRVSEGTPLLDTETTLPSFSSRRNQHLPATPVALAPYSGYGTVDWLRALVQNSRAEASSSSSSASSSSSYRRWWRPARSWLAACAIGVATALVAFAVDVSVETVSDWKAGRCAGGFWLNKRSCCALDAGECRHWRPWAESFPYAYLIYVAAAVAFGAVASALSMTTRHDLVVDGVDRGGAGEQERPAVVAKTMYMATGSGIPEIKSVLSGFEIPHLLDFKVMVVKSVGAVFAVATAMCLGKEGPFVHISTCIGHLVARCLPECAGNAMRLREMLSVACSAGLSVAFGAPIGGVLFSYEEISTYFPRRVLWRAFLCSLVAAAVLRELNPTGTGKLVLFETRYADVAYDAAHYAVFVLLGVCGGVFGGVFCAANSAWSRTFRRLALIRASPVLEVCVVALATALLQYPNPLLRETGDKVMERLLVDCSAAQEDWICAAEAGARDGKGGGGAFYAWLASGTLVKLVLTVVTFGCKLPSGVIIPALDAGALFGRMVGQLVPGVSSPGVFAMVGSAAFLAGVCRMTVSLAVIMFELTGEVNYIPPFMVAILTAKWVADYISADGVYDVAQNLVGHPFLDAEQALEKLQKQQKQQQQQHRNRKEATLPIRVEALLPPHELDAPMTLRVTPERQADVSHLRSKLAEAARRGIPEPGFAMVNDGGICCGYVSGQDLRAIVDAVDKDATAERGGVVDLAAEELAAWVDASPICLSGKAPVEHAVELFSKLGVAYVAVVAEDSSRFVGLVTRKDLLRFLDSLE